MENVDEILSRLDRSVPDAFPTMDHPYLFLAKARLTAYSDASCWAMTIEQLAFASTADEYDRFRAMIFAYGNCLTGPPGLTAAGFLAPVSEGDDGYLFDDIMNIAPDVRTLRIRGHLVGFDATPSNFAARGIELTDPPTVHAWEFLRLLALDHGKELLPTEAERRRRIKVPLAEILQLDEWHHPDIMNREKPSDTQCFRSLARALANGDATLYEPTEPPNTDWRNWPRAGML